MTGGEKNYIKIIDNIDIVKSITLLDDHFEDRMKRRQGQSQHLG